MSNEPLRRPSPHPGNPQQVPPGQGSQPQQLPVMVGPNLVRAAQPVMAQRLAILRNQMVALEQQIKLLHLQLNPARGTPQEPQLMQRIKELAMEFNKRKEYIQRYTQGMETFRCVPL